MAKKSASKKEVSFEESLWDSANKLRGSVESSEYKHVVLSLIFLKFASERFEHRRQELIKEGKEQYADMVEFYTMKNVFYLPKKARWDYIEKHSKQDDIAVKIDTALFTVEKNNKSLKGALPDNYFSRLGLDVSKLAALIDTINNIHTLKNKEEDVVGRVYEYFLGKFAASEGKKGGEFYTPRCIVNLIAEMIEPYKGKIYDPCCGSGGMFVQSMKFVENHHGNKKNIAIYGQEYTNTTYKLAKMNLAIRGISSNLGDKPADTFREDQHKDLKADYIMANPPFNQKAWRGPDELTDDPRWAGYETPPTGNANYGWILHMISKLSKNGVAGFVLANGSMSTNTNSEGEIRKQIIKNDLVDCMIALPGQLFYTTSIPVCLWFITKNKKADTKKGYRDRCGETLFIDARKMGSLIDRTHRELSDGRFKIDELKEIGLNSKKVSKTLLKHDIVRKIDEKTLLLTSQINTLKAELEPLFSDDLDKIYDLLSSIPNEIAEIARTYHAWRGEEKDGTYEDKPGFCKSAKLDEIKSHHYVLTPGRYVGTAPIEDDGIPFEEKMTKLTDTLYEQMKESAKLDKVIRKNMDYLGFGE